MLIWLESREIMHFHHLLIDEHGGLHGLKNEGALESTLARPQNLLSYHPDTPVTSPAACYGFGFCPNHVFSDGNKRIALTAINIFLQLNGWNLACSQAEAVHVIREVASGSLNESLLAAWIHENSEPFDLDNSQATKKPPSITIAGIPAPCTAIAVIPDHRQVRLESSCSGWIPEIASQLWNDESETLE